MKCLLTPAYNNPFLIQMKFRKYANAAFPLIHDQIQNVHYVPSRWMYTVNLWMKSHLKVSKYAMRDQTSK